VKSPSIFHGPVSEVTVHRLNEVAGSEDADYVATEDPLEIRVEGQSVAVVMRTPGEDGELAAGFLVTEGLIRATKEIRDIRHHSHCLFSSADPSQLFDSPRASQSRAVSNHMPQHQSNVINVRLSKPESMNLAKLTRHLFTSSSCGICSKSSIKAVRQQFAAVENAFTIEPRVLLKLPRALSSAQKTFKRTGGLHACAVFEPTGKMLALREDVGRHNALDKLVGWALLGNHLPLSNHILLLSGRVSFEMMQKALAAGIGMVAAISAPSSLAVEFARQSGQTLVGFLRDERMNIYAGEGRVRQPRSKRRIIRLSAS
jgi:FdhD protein